MGIKREDVSSTLDARASIAGEGPRDAANALAAGERARDIAKDARECAAATAAATTTTATTTNTSAAAASTAASTAAAAAAAATSSTDGFTIGCHLSSAKGYARMAKDALSIGANTFQFFTRNPRGGKAKPIDPGDIAAFCKLAGEGGITQFLAHAPYTLNPASAKPETREFAVRTLADDLERMEFTPHQMYNMHPGCHVGQGVEAGIELIAAALNTVIKPEQTTLLLLETMAGKGTEVGRTFEELAAIIERVELSEHVGVCLDTCHVWDAGYDVAGDLDSVLAEFDRVIGLERLCAVHLNDSKNPCGSHKDRHEVIGGGHIGVDAFARIVNHPALRDLPFFLETPHDSLAEWGEEIAALRAVRVSS